MSIAETTERIGTVAANGRNGAKPEASVEPAIRIERIRRQVLVVPVVGTTPLIMHRWSEKAIAMMRETQMGSAVKPKKAPKTPEQDAHDATYWIVDGEVPGFPATAFKAAMVGACRSFDKTITMVGAKTMFHIHGEGPEQLVPLLGSQWSMREDTPRNSNGQPDLRYRNQFWPWSVELHVEFAPSRIDAGSVIALIDEAGRGGVGDWRPSAPKSSTGTYGQFRVDDSKQVRIEEV